MISAKKVHHLFTGPAMFSDETSEYMQKKYNLTPEGKSKENPSNVNPSQEQQKREAAPTRSGGSGSAGVLPKSGMDRPRLYKKGGKVVHDWHGFGKSGTGKHKHGF
jgi:hypothetical protein